MSARALRGGVLGFLVNHLGGRWSEEIPDLALPSISKSSFMNRCGRARSVVMPYLNGIRRCMLKIRSSELVMRSGIGCSSLNVASGRAFLPDTHPCNHRCVAQGVNRFRVGVYRDGRGMTSETSRDNFHRYRSLALLGLERAGSQS